MIFGNVLVTGASRGLGLELVRQLAPVSRLVVATCRNPEAANDLTSIADKNDNVIIKKLDVEIMESFAPFAEDLKSCEQIKTNGLSCLINNAGYSPKSTRYTMVTCEQMSKTLTVNAVAPLMLSKTLIPLLKISSARSMIVNMSSILGSIHQNHPSFGPGQGGLYPYRSSKTALNMITRSLSIDLAPLNISVVSIHPGWVRTDMGGKNAPLQPEQSIKGVIRVLSELDREKLNGNFVDYEGNDVQW